MINEILKSLGFSEKEIAVYICILEQGKVSAATVARITKINRTTVYSVSKELIKRGIIAEDLAGTQRYFTALPVETLQKAYTEEEQALKKKKEAIDGLMKELSTLPKSKHYSVPKIRFIDEFGISDFLIKQLPVWIESAKTTDKNWWGFQDTSFIDEYPEWFKYHWEIFPADFGTRLFTNKKPSEEKFAEHVKDTDRRQIKYWDVSEEFTATHAVLGNYVLFCMTREHPHYLVEIHDSVMAENLRQMFKGMWEKM